jgi:hypothetical protein
VCEAVLRGLLPYVKELKSAFVLLPAEGSGLPSLLQSRLNTPCILQVMKVRHAVFVVGCEKQQHSSRDACRGTLPPQARLRMHATLTCVDCDRFGVG